MLRQSYCSIRGRPRDPALLQFAWKRLVRRERVDAAADAAAERALEVEGAGVAADGESHRCAVAAHLRSRQTFERRQRHTVARRRLVLAHLEMDGAGLLVRRPNGPRARLSRRRLGLAGRRGRSVRLDMSDMCRSRAGEGLGDARGRLEDREVVDLGAQRFGPHCQHGQRQQRRGRCHGADQPGALAGNRAIACGVEDRQHASFELSRPCHAHCQRRRAEAAKVVGDLQQMSGVVARCRSPRATRGRRRPARVRRGVVARPTTPPDAASTPRKRPPPAAASGSRGARHAPARAATPRGAAPSSRCRQWTGSGWRAVRTPTAIGIDRSRLRSRRTGRETPRCAAHSVQQRHPVRIADLSGTSDQPPGRYLLHAEASDHGDQPGRVHHECQGRP